MSRVELDPESLGGGASERMRGVARRDTAPEKALRSVLFSRGCRYRVDARPTPELRTRADIVFPGPRLAVFVDGCFWHGCPVHATWPKTNASFWKAKIEANRRRDKLTTQKLEESGWAVIRVWEHEDPAEAADRIQAALAQEPR